MNQTSVLERFTRSTQRYDDLEKPTAAAVETGSRYVIYGPNEFFWSSAMAERAYSNEFSGAARANQLLRMSLESSIEQPVFMNWSNQFLEAPQSSLADDHFFTILVDDVKVDDNIGLAIEATLNELVGRWRKETSFLSSVTAKIENQWYQKIIALGLPAIPFLLRKLRQRPDPIGNRPEIRGDMQAMADCWIAWGEERGYI